MANPNPPPPPARYRFTTSNAAYHGARARPSGSAGSWSGSQPPGPGSGPGGNWRPKRRHLGVALSILHACFGPPWRRRKSPPGSAIITLLPDAVQTLGRLMNEGTEDVQLRAAKAVLELVLPPPPGREAAPATLSQAIGAMHNASLR